MKVFIAGATGVLGHRLVGRLADRGHEVHGLVRDDDGADLVEAHGGTPRRGDVLELETLNRAIDDDVEAIVHAATYFPVKMKPTEEDWAKNDRIRLEGAKNLVAAVGPSLDQFVFPSVVWVARRPDGSFFDERAPRNPDRGTKSAAETESYLEQAAGSRDFDTAILRTGFYYGPDAGHTQFWARKLIDGDMPIVGGGLLGREDAQMCFLHLDDAACAFATAVHEQVRGLYHVVDEKPVTGADFFSEFADLLGAPDPGRIPAWLARLFVGKVNAKGFTSPYPTTNSRFRRETEWEPEYPTYREGLAAVVDTWLEEEQLVVTPEGFQWGEDIPTRYQCRSCGRHFHVNSRACPNCAAENRMLTR